MTNRELSIIFYDIAELYAIDDSKFKARAYEKVAQTINDLDKDVADLYNKALRSGDSISALKILEKIPGVGPSISKKIEEYIKTGHIGKHEEFKKKTMARDRSLLREDIKNSKGLIDLSDILGDFHCHSHWNIKKGMIEELAKKAKGLGYSYIGISDHTKALGIEHGLNEKELMQQSKYIEKINRQFKIKNLSAGRRGLKFKILHGCEANILKDGSIDIDDNTLSKLDFVIAGAHSRLNMSKSEMTERIIKAMENPHVDIISHPTNRVIGKRPESKLDFSKILKTAKRTGTILEINANPPRLDLKYSNIKKAKIAGVKMIIGTDAHRVNQMDFMKFGVAQARRGGCEAKDIINILPLNKLVALFKKPKNRRF